MTSQESVAGGRRHGGRACGAATVDAVDRWRSGLENAGVQGAMRLAD